MDKLYSLHCDKWQVALLVSLSCLMLFTAGIVGYLLKGNNQQDTTLYMQAFSYWEQELQTQRNTLEYVRQHADKQLAILAKRTVELETQIQRLASTGVKLAQAIQLDLYEPTVYEALFQNVWQDNTPIPTTSETATDFIFKLDTLAQQLTVQTEQLAVLEKLLLQPDITAPMLTLEHIVDAGSISSPYGYRTDPITRQKTWHAGIDIAAQPGTIIKAVAPGVVSFAGRRAGYGNLVEIDHGNGFSTLYAHNRNNLVVRGDIVKGGQAVAQMGSSGRATGPHVHFELLRQGVHLNPLTYLVLPYTK